MAEKYDVAVVGVGSDPEEVDRDGFAMGYRHAEAYRSLDNCTLVACVDIDIERAKRFADSFGPGIEVHGGHDALLAAAEPDAVSVCVPPDAHADVVVDCVEAGVDVVHCEKPLADTWGGCERMVEAAAAHGTQLTVNHQRRFGEPFVRARAILGGDVGELERVEFAAPNLYDYGTHSFDLCSFFVDESLPEWVIAGLDYGQENLWFGAHNETQAVAQWRYENGVHGLAATGETTGPELVGCHHRLICTDGVIEIGRGFPGGHDGDVLRVRRDNGWETVNCGEGLYEETYICRAIASAVAHAGVDATPPHAASNVMKPTALAFGAWESVRRRGRVEFPLVIDDNPLEAMVTSGDLEPAPREDESMYFG